MNQFTKSIFIALIFTLLIKFTLGQNFIEIRIDPNNDTSLLLSDGGVTKLGNVTNRKVQWKKMDPNIQSIQIVPKHGTDYPFKDNPTTPHSPVVNATVRFLGPTGDWFYNIKWKTRDHEYNFDPKIAVRPIASPFMELIILLGFIISLITSIVNYRKWQKAERQLKNPRQNK